MRLERQVSDAIVVDLLSLQLSRSYPIAHRHLQTAMHQRTEKDPSQIVLTRANARSLLLPTTSMSGGRPSYGFPVRGELACAGLYLPGWEKSVYTIDKSQKFDFQPSTIKSDNKNHLTVETGQVWLLR